VSTFADIGCNVVSAALQLLTAVQLTVIGVREASAVSDMDGPASPGSGNRSQTDDDQRSI
jgi:hypothetical protein